MLLVPHVLCACDRSPSHSRSNAPNALHLLRHSCINISYVCDAFLACQAHFDAIPDCHKRRSPSYSEHSAASPAVVPTRVFLLNVLMHAYAVILCYHDFGGIWRLQEH